MTGISIGPDTSFCGHLAITLDAGAGFAGYLWSDGSAGQTLQVDSTGFGNGEELIWAEVTDIGGATKRDSILVNFLDCASILEFAKGVKVTVFPNPNRGQFNIQAEGLLDKVEIKLFDVSGKALLRKEMSSPGKEEIDLSIYPKGQYLLRIETGKEIKIEKVLYR
jgi:hypothetical protein